MNRFQGEVLFILSGNDLVASEFEYLVSHDRQWKKGLRFTTNHTEKTT